MEKALATLSNLTSYVSEAWPKSPAVAPPVVFLFAGQNTEFYGMASGLYNSFSVFRSEIDHCLSFVPKENNLRYNITQVLLAEPGKYNSEEKIPTNIAQPSLLIFQYSCAKLFLACGISPNSMIGHSLGIRIFYLFLRLCLCLLTNFIGEYTAACIAGVLSVEDAIRIVCKRGDILHSLQGKGAILVTQTSEQEARSLATNSIFKLFTKKISII